MQREVYETVEPRVCRRQLLSLACWRQSSMYSPWVCPFSLGSLPLLYGRDAYSLRDSDTPCGNTPLPLSLSPLP